MRFFYEDDRESDVDVCGRGYSDDDDYSYDDEWDSIGL